jgi:hypothetical protein
VGTSVGKPPVRVTAGVSGLVLIAGLFLWMATHGGFPGGPGGSPPTAQAGTSSASPTASRPPTRVTAAQAKTLASQLSSGDTAQVAKAVQLIPGETPSARLVNGLAGDTLAMDVAAQRLNSDGTVWVPTTRRTGTGPATRWRLLLMYTGDRWVLVVTGKGTG